MLSEGPWSQLSAMGAFEKRLQVARGCSSPLRSARGEYGVLGLQILNLHMQCPSLLSACFLLQPAGVTRTDSGHSRELQVTAGNPDNVNRASQTRPTWSAVIGNSQPERESILCGRPKHIKRHELPHIEPLGVEYSPRSHWLRAWSRHPGAESLAMLPEGPKHGLDRAPSCLQSPADQRWLCCQPAVADGSTWHLCQGTDFILPGKSRRSVRPHLDSRAHDQLQPVQHPEPSEVHHVRTRKPPYRVKLRWRLT